jgi:xylan 1,4-beta-xylosidase
MAGSPLDFISFHAKGAPEIIEGHVRMGLSEHLRSVERGIEIVASLAESEGLPAILSESDPEGCTACSARAFPQNAYRNGTLYPAYTAVALASTLKLTGRHKIQIEGMLAWAFEFEDQPYFDGLRTLATNGIDKPELNLFRMAGLMRGERLKVESTGSLGIDTILQSGVHDKPDVDALAARMDRSITIMVWNYHDDDLPASDASVKLRLAGTPAAAQRLLVDHYHIDCEHSNAYTIWLEMGSPQNPTPEQYGRLKVAGQLQLLESPRWIKNTNGNAKFACTLPRQAISLLELSW